jgi:tetratricopeptide repeat protein/cytochrome c554/c'-like protein
MVFGENAVVGRRRGIAFAVSRALVLILPLSAADADTDSRICARCHPAIFESYSRTAMAQSSGRVTRIEREGQFRHQSSGVRYRVHNEGADVFFDFELPGVKGRRRLEYFIGSGAIGKSFIYGVDSFFYQAPVSWYAGHAAWGLSPGYESANGLYLTRPVELACLECHASRLRPLRGTQNGYESPPFLENGVSCERCHGSGDQHVLGKGRIVNPTALAPDRRDSICEQCHIQGEARIARASTAQAFRPGERLWDYVVVFVWRGNSTEMKVTSHFERLLQSSCKRLAGDQLWCGTCHDPHRQPSDAEKGAYYRGKCLRCHEANRCVRGADCRACHMPKTQVLDVEHAVYTDHAIRKPGTVAAVSESSRSRQLVPFGEAIAGDRELGLAYAAVPGFGDRAIRYLERSRSRDALVLVNLAFLYDQSGREEKAIPLYREALRVDPEQVIAAVNLGSSLAKRGRTNEAISLWRQALERSPGLETVRMNLASAQLRIGDLTGAEASLAKLLELNPGATVALDLLNRMRPKP